MTPEELEELNKIALTSYHLGQGAMKGVATNIEKLNSVVNRLFEALKKIIPENDSMRKEIESLTNENQRLEYLYRLESTNKQFFARAYRRAVADGLAQSHDLIQEVDALKAIVNKDPKMQDYWNFVSAMDEENSKLRAEIAQLYTTNQAATERIDTLKNENSHLTKSGKTKNIIMLAEGVAIVVLSALLIANAAKKNNGNSGGEATIDTTALKTNVAGIYDSGMKLADGTEVVFVSISDSLKSGKDALAEEDQDNPTVQETTAKLNDTSESVQFVIGKLDELKTNITVSKEALETATYDELVNSIGTASNYLNQSYTYLINAGNYIGEARFGLEVANAVSKADLTEQINSLTTNNAALAAANETLVAENETLSADNATLAAAKQALAEIVEAAEKRYDDLVSSIYSTYDYTYEQAGFSWSDVSVEDGKIKTFGALDERFDNIVLSEEGLASYNSGEDAPIKTNYIASLGDNTKLHEGLVTVMASSYTHQEEPTTPSGNENGGSTDVAENDDEGKTPNSTTGAESGETPESPNSGSSGSNPDENQNGDGNTPVNTEIGDEEPGNEDQPEDPTGGWGY